MTKALPKCDPIMMVRTLTYEMMFRAFQISDSDGTISSVSMVWDKSTKTIQSITHYTIEENGEFRETLIDHKASGNERLISILTKFI